MTQKTYCIGWGGFRVQITAIQMQIVNSFREWHEVTCIWITITELTLSPVTDSKESLTMYDRKHEKGNLPPCLVVIIRFVHSNI